MGQRLQHHRLTQNHHDFEEASPGSKRSTRNVHSSKFITKLMNCSRMGRRNRPEDSIWEAEGRSHIESRSRKENRLWANLGAGKGDLERGEREEGRFENWGNFFMGVCIWVGMGRKGGCRSIPANFIGNFKRFLKVAITDIVRSNSTVR